MITAVSLVLAGMNLGFLAGVLLSERVIGRQRRTIADLEAEAARLALLRRLRVDAPTGEVRP